MLQKSGLISLEGRMELGEKGVIVVTPKRMERILGHTGQAREGRRGKYMQKRVV